VPAALVHTKTHPLGWQRTLDEHGFALDARNAATIVCQIDDIGFLNRT
jgi:hypothetical protein